MRTYLTLVFLYTSLTGVKAGYFTEVCDPTDSSSITVSHQQYDVTDNSFTIYSHDDYYDHSYQTNYRRCIEIWTNRTDYVIKLEEEDFRLEGGYSCIFDYLEMYFSSMDIADTWDNDGKWCGSSGPGTKYSSNNHLFLHFYSDTSEVYSGFRFIVSSIYQDDVPVQLSAGAIVGIVFGVLVVIVIIILIVVCVLMQKKKPGSVHAAQQGPRVHQNVAIVSSTTYHKPQVVGRFVPPPQYQQQPPPYQANYGMGQTMQPAGHPPPPPAQNTAYPPPAAIYSEPTAQQPQNGGLYQAS